MGFINWLFGNEQQQQSRARSHATGTVSRPRHENGKNFTLVKGNFDPDGDDSDFEWCGFHIHDDQGVGVAYSEAEQRNLHIFRVAGVSYRANALQSSDFDPGSVLKLVAEENNRYDHNAVSVWNQSGTVMVGYVPKERNKCIRAVMRFPGNRAIALAEHRKGGKRVSLTVLLTPVQVKCEAPERRIDHVSTMSSLRTDASPRNGRGGPAPTP